MSAETSNQSARSAPDLLAGLAAICLLVLLPVSMVLYLPSPATRASTYASAGNAAQIASTHYSPPRPRSGPEWYFRSGRWRADTLTFFAAVRYVLEPEPSLPTNHAAVRA